MKKSICLKASVLLLENACMYLKGMKLIFGKKYSRMDQLKFFAWLILESFLDLDSSPNINNFNKNFD